MSHQAQTEFTVDRLHEFLRQAHRHAFSPKVHTFFSIGRKLYENPTSDVLAYLMHPDGLHGLGSMFLQTFFRCMGIDYDKLNLSFNGVNILREHSLDGGRMDFLITGHDWALVIENKIDHGPLNPFPLYVKHAKLHCAKPFFAILSPNGHEVPDWKSVTYNEYCGAIKRALPTISIDSDSYKWHVFAKEFILHLESNLNETMILNETKIAFVEANMQAIAEVKKLSEAYMPMLLEQINNALVKAVPGRQFQVENREWAIVCLDRSMQYFYLGTPLHCHPCQKFRAGYWVKGLTEEQRNNVREMLPAIGVQYSPGQGGSGDGEFGTLQEAMDAFCKLAKAAC